MLSCSPNPHDPQSYCSTLDGLMKSNQQKLNDAKNTNKTNEISSLESQIKLLQSNKDDCTKSHYMDEQRASSLEGEVHHGIDVIVKLTQFSGSEKSIIELIEKEIARLTKQHEDCENCKKSPQSPASSDCAQHKKLEELKKKLKTLKQNNDNNPHDLLTNLCSGLEKFLGYQETSKGYDGTGIVYSDLDRLCDGVMSFLHGVLHNIQPKLGLHKNNIQSAIMSLEANKHSGKDGFNTAIRAVVQGVREYNEGVKASNKSVSDVITTLRDSVNDSFVKSVEYILRENNDAGEKINYKDKDITEAERQIDIKLEDCKKNAAAFITNLDTSRSTHKDSISDLNAKLKDKLESVRKTVKYEGERLGRVKGYESEQLKQAIKKVEDVMSALKTDVDCRISEDVRAFVAALKEKVRPIKEKLEEVDGKLAKYIFDLEQWIVNVEKIVSDTDKQVNIILAQINVDDPTKHPALINQAVEHITLQVNRLNEQVSEVKKKFDELFKKIKGADGKGTEKECVMYKLEGVEREFKKQVPKELNGFQKGALNNVWNLKYSIDLLIGAVKTNVGSFVDTFKDALKEGVDGTKGILNRSEIPGLKALVTKLAAHREFRSLGGFLETVRDDPSRGQTLEQVLKHLYDAKNEWRGRPTSQEIYAKIKSTLQDQAAEGDIFNNSLGNLLNEAAIKGIENLQTAVNAIVTSELTPIQNDVGPFETSANEAYVELLNHVNAVSSNLGQLCGAIKKAAESDPDSAKAKLNELKEKYFIKYSEGAKNSQNSIKKIRHDLRALQTPVSNALKEAKDLLDTYLERADKHYIQVITDHVNTEIKSAQTTLTTHARRQYVEALKFALQQFADKVTGELSELPGMIEDDKHIGLKGFMEKFSEHFNAHIVPQKEDPKLVHLSFAVARFFGPLKDYVLRDIKRENEENIKKNPSLPQSQDPYSAKLDAVSTALMTLLGDISTKNHYDHNLPTKLADLTATLSDLKLDGFPNPVTVMLGGISGGCRQLVEVLGNVYISKYDGQTIEWEKADTSKKPATKDGTENKIPTDDANRCAKVFLTCMYTLFDKLHHLFYNGGKTWSQLKLDGSGDAKKKYELKKYFMHEGFEIKNLITKENTGKAVAFRLSRAFSRYQTFNKDPNEFDSFDLYIAHFRKYEGLLSRLFEHLEKYNEVCHFATFTSKKHPSSIYEMLAWFSGLPYSSVYDSLLHDVLPSLLEGPSKKPADDDEIVVTDLGEESFDAYPQPITYSSLATSLNDVCAQSYDVLTGVLGYGYADGVYACDHSNNTLNLAYPSSANACLGMMVDIMNRLFYQLYFLLTQCSHNTDYSGWSNCSYGQGVGNSGWQCNDNLCPNQQCNLRPNQNADQSTNQKCNQHPKCGVKSPLQSYLEDSLPGFLPHTFSNVGCGVKCSVGNHFGKPCLTPMGFTDISIKASHTKEGTYLQKVLEKFCGIDHAPLTKLCGQLNCLLPTAPKTLGDMFSFYHNFLSDWNRNTPHRKGAFEEAISKANFKRPYEGLNAHSIFGGSHPHKQANADLVSLVCSSATRGKCGPYLHALNTDISSMYSKEHGGKYLSWIVYSTETFYNLLHQLYEECSSKCGGENPKCRIAKCRPKCTVTEKSATSPHDASCNSIAKCSHTRPIMYKFGFVHANVAKLAGDTTKRTCNDFCNVLKKVIGEGCALVKLIEDIDKYIWAIREEFSLTLLALWSLSLLYLLHIAVVRLDVLRIRSHLRSPSSHRIAAQSLLAAARVKALANVKYFSP
ncbi:hypothetical protein, conserved [Babesia ovata]|uniref:Uncharacterized protein n=1 Tax=Babesia ovata TaxID=189622 RepID=A0A2H6KJH9_9APIC|nr:uncharacterized protein BOVATA_046480 [Babesia ovata]GBE63155.1 hypothetical protein, conserved [Babesia ovata]